MAFCTRDRRAGYGALAQSSGTFNNVDVAVRLSGQARLLSDPAHDCALMVQAYGHRTWRCKRVGLAADRQDGSFAVYHAQQVAQPVGTGNHWRPSCAAMAADDEQVHVESAIDAHSRRRRAASNTSRA